MLGGGAFVDDLRAMIDAGRAFGRHPLTCVLPLYGMQVGVSVPLL